MVLRGSVYSNALGMETGITVITPNDYGQARQYRVCFVLHGLCGGNGDYSNYTMLPFYAVERDIIFVCPEVQRGFYTDTKYGAKYFTYVSEELVHLTRLVFNVSAKREDTAIMGGSMGGYGALKCALAKPEQYGFCAAFAPACLDMRDYFKRCAEGAKCDFSDFYGIFGNPLEYREGDDVLALAEKAAALPVLPRLVTFCGDSDSLIPMNRSFAAEMKKLGISYEYEEFPGKHDLPFFNDAVKKAVELWDKKPQ